MNRNELEQALLEDVNSGWRGEFPDLTPEQLKRLKDFFPEVEPNEFTDVDRYLNQVYQSYIRNVLWCQSSSKIDPVSASKTDPPTFGKAIRREAPT